MAFVLLPAFLFCLNRFPEFANVWSDCISRPALKMLNSISGWMPFSLLEWGSLFGISLVMAGFFVELIRSGWWFSIRNLFLRMIKISFALILCFFMLWFPLYFSGKNTAFTVSDAQLEASCRNLIAELNASPPDFSQLPEDLPGKQAAFPFWMEQMNIIGFYSFFTGEALLLPDLPDCAVPFVAVHEAMHGLGYADEGATNIAAWQECMRRGGTYAGSARVRALRDSLTLLKDRNRSAFESCLREINPVINECLHSLGSGPEQVKPWVQSLFSLLGVKKGLQNYEMLALYLAASMPE